MVPTIDTVDYNKRMIAISNNDTTGRWPVKRLYPLPGAILPYNRIIAFYGNLYSTRMGILGEIPREQMIANYKESYQMECCRFYGKSDSSII
jgi:hypothetical protein